MSPLLLMRFLPYAAGLLLLIGGVAAIHHHGVVEGRDESQAQRDKEKAEQVAAHLQKTLANQKLIQHLEETKNVNVIEINRLRANNHALWVRLPKTACSSATPTADSPATPASGVISTSPESGQGEVSGGVAQQAFDDYERGRDDEAYRADTLVEDCRVLHDWAESISAND